MMLNQTNSIYSVWCKAGEAPTYVYHNTSEFVPTPGTPLEAEAFAPSLETNLTPADYTLDPSDVLLQAAADFRNGTTANSNNGQDVVYARSDGSDGAILTYIRRTIVNAGVGTYDTTSVPVPASSMDQDVPTFALMG